MDQTANTQQAQRARDQLRLWREELIDLTKRNTSLYYKATKNASLEVVAPDDGAVLRLLEGGRSLRFLVPPAGVQEWRPEPGSVVLSADELLSDKPSEARLASSLRTIASTAEHDFQDSGLQTLYLAAGMLRWTDGDDDEVYSPLLYVPVRLERTSPREPYQLTLQDDDPVVNAALQAKLQRDFGLDLPAYDKLARQPEEEGASDLQQAYTALLQVTTELCAGRTWQVQRRLVLKRATFHKDAMFRDLQDNADAILAHDLVLALAGVAPVEAVSVPDPQAMDSLAPPEDALIIRDADSSQRACIKAAIDGLSFVMDGPPGTGKSQTIANMIGELTQRGKTVLFVSEKAAALDVVASRLADRGLDDLYLELHSHKTSRKAVVDELSKALRQRPQLQPGLTDSDKADARRQRQALSAHARAMNRTRPPLGRSLADVVGLVAQLQQAPLVPTPDLDPATLTPERMQELRERFEGLARVWHLRLEEDFPWHGHEASGLSRTAATELELDLAQLLERVQQLQDQSDGLAEDLGVLAPADLSDVRSLTDLAAHLQVQPPTEREWWTEDLKPVQTRLVRLAHDIETARTSGAPLDSGWVGWRSTDGEGVSRLTQLTAQLAAHPSMYPANAALDAERIRHRMQELAGAATVLDELAQAADAAAAAFGLEPRSRSREDARSLLTLATNADAATRPESSWATPAIINKVARALDVLTPLVEDYHRRREALSATFTDGLFDLDVEAVDERYRTQHTWWRKLGSTYRTDKQAVAAVSRSGKASRDVVAQLGDAAELAALGRKLDDAETPARSLLGRYYQPRATEVSAARDALQTLQRAVEVLGRDYRDSVVDQLGGDGPQDPRLATDASQQLRTFDAWATQHPTLHTLTEHGSIAQVVADMRTVVQAGTALAEEFDQLRPSRPQTLTEIQGLIDALTSHRAASRAITEAESTDRQLFGQGYAGIRTDVATLTAQLAWVTRLRELTEDSLTSFAITGLHGRTAFPATGPIEALAADVVSRIDKLVGGFTDGPHSRVREELHGTFEDATEFLQLLRDRIDDLTAYSHLLDHEAALQQAGFSDALARVTTDQRPAESVPDAFTRATYVRWLDHELEQDSALRSVLADDLDARVNAFRNADVRLIDRAPYEILRATVERRPTQRTAAAQFIEKEAGKKRRHAPVRTVMDKSFDIIEKLRPCFMMSPLSVSQFLPARQLFDVVIFDEASQVTPADAVNCIYRGTQLIVAGDERQLPPTSFFALGADEDEGYQEDQIEEFESVLQLAKSQGGLPQLGLRWHYRSQHEDLITFSNYRFYDGELVTFPSAMSSSPDLGVELHRVDGVYARGGARNNPIEAEQIAHRVIEIATASPDLSVGVVAFSKAQQDMIEHAIERARLERPDLDDWFDGDRLTGLFVKNLETVQGDERDVILFSIGYGPDEDGKFTLNFGPLNREGGWRRLNVAVTRARKRVEIFSSFGAGQMDERGTTNRGVLELKRYLDFADRGPAALSLELGAGNGDVESPFEASVLSVLQGWGYDVVPQVGAAGYRIDLGIRHPDRPGAYALGVECDGAAYHSSQVARDRDRLRQAVLEGLGWQLYRIWGPSWYRDRPQQELRLREAVEAAIAGRMPKSTTASLSRIEYDTADEVDLAAAPDWVVPYKLVQLTASSFRGRPDQTPAAVRRVVAEVIAAEAPVSIGVIGRRVAQAWGVNLTKSVRKVVEPAVDGVVRADDNLTRDGDFVIDRRRGVTLVRGRSEDDAYRREITELPPNELDAAVTQLVRDGIVMTRDDVLDGVKVVFGFDRAGANIQAAVDASLDRCLRSGLLADEQHGQFRVTKA